MKIPAVLDEIVRRAGKRQTLAAGGTDLNGNAGAGIFKNILKAQLAASGESVSRGGPAGLGDEKNISQVVEIIRLRMMLDEHLLESMRDKGDDQSLYQRFSRWQLGGLNAVSPPAVQEKPGHEKPAPAAVEDVPSVVRVRNGADRARQYEPMIRQASETYGVDAGLIRAVIRAESNFRNESTSPKGAMGLMQIMPATAKDLGIRDAYDAHENIMGGTRYLKGLLERYRGDVPTALAAYNWGMGNVERRPENLPRETRVYINRIQQFMDERNT
jgi:hypothetical protein